MKNVMLIGLMLCGLWEVWSEQPDGGMSSVTLEASNAVEAIEKSIDRSTDRHVQIKSIREVKQVLPIYEIWANGYVYAGESDTVENAPPAVGKGWSGKGPTNRNGISWSTDKPHQMLGSRNMRSHLERILDRSPEIPELTIKQVGRE